MADEDVDGEPGKKTPAEIAAERVRSLGGKKAYHPPVDTVQKPPPKKGPPPPVKKR